MRATIGAVIVLLIFLGWLWYSSFRHRQQCKTGMPSEERIQHDLRVRVLTSIFLYIWPILIVLDVIIYPLREWISAFFLIWMVFLFFAVRNLIRIKNKEFDLHPTTTVDRHMHEYTDSDGNPSAIYRVTTRANNGYYLRLSSRVLYSYTREGDILLIVSWRGSKRTQLYYAYRDSNRYANGWTCTCGRNNADYILTCFCGVTKREVVNVATKNAKQNESAKTPAGGPVRTSNGWRCSCGKEYPPFVSSCGCGVNKRDIM